MEHAKVVIFDDEEIDRKCAQRNLEAAGHEVVFEASTLQDALDAVDAMAAGELIADVILLDSNIENINGDDARTIADQIEVRGLRQKVIGFSATLMDDFGVTVDFDSGRDVNQVVAAINSI